MIKGFNAEEKFNDKFQESTNRFYHFSNTLLNRQNLASPTSEFLGIVTIAALLWYGGSMVLIDKTLSGGAFIGFMALAYQILTPAKAISKASYKVRAGNAAADRVLEVLNTVSPLEDKVDAKTKDGFSSNIKIDNISFKYENDLVLKNFTLNVPKGESVALVGQSGSGKSTIANLFMGIYTPTKGRILIDGYPIEEYDRDSLRKLFGYVAQDIFLFSESIRDNILFGSHEEVSEEQLQKAMDMASLSQEVDKFPDKLETLLGERGITLSGGQKQRTAIARALIKNPNILLIDDGLSAVDTKTEVAIKQALAAASDGGTFINISHRISSVQDADLVLFLDSGKILESGTHNALLNQAGSYAELYQRQLMQAEEQEA